MTVNDPYADFRTDTLSGAEATAIDGDDPVTVISEVGKSGAYVASTLSAYAYGIESLR